MHAAQQSAALPPMLLPGRRLDKCADAVVVGDEVGDEVYVYGGGADHVVGLARCRLADLIDYARFG